LSNHIKVILFPQPLYWSFWDYAEGQANRIEEWYQRDLSQEGRDKFDALLKNTAKIKNHLEWGGKFKYLQGESKQERIWQLDFIADKRQYRLHGVFRAGRRAVLLSGCFHKGNRYTPENALDTARKRATALREGRATIHERKIKHDI
jgi:hypothetical protein